MVPEAYEPAMSVIPAWTLKIIRFHFQKKKIVKNKKKQGPGRSFGHICSAFWTNPIPV